jgi:hypothetical protein
LNAADKPAPDDEPYPLDKQTYQTTKLFTTKSLSRNGTGACKPKVYKGNAYATYMRQEDKRVMVAKVPLDGSAAVTLPLVTVKDADPKQRGYTAPIDNHSVYIIDVDRSGYIHVCGGMHTSDITYWRSDRPEDISSFTRIMPDDKLPPDTQPCPISGKLTFPVFFSDRHGKLFWTCVQGFGPLCSYDETKKLWTALGKPLFPLTKNKQHTKDISYYYTDKTSHDTTDTTVVKGGLSQKFFDVAWDSKDRMHMVFGLLNKHTYKKSGGGAHTILYAYSDDGGKTVFKSNGEQIELPILPDAGSHQGEVITSEGGRQAHIAVDKANRPMIFWSKSGTHCSRLESGRWVDYPGAPSGSGGAYSIDPNGVVICNHVHRQDKQVFTRFWNPDGHNSQTLDLTAVRGYDREYYRVSGELVWTSISGRGENKDTYTMHRTVFDPVSK